MATKKKPILGTRGPLPGEIRDYIARFHDKMTAEQIAAQFKNKRSASQIQKYINKEFGDNKPIRKEMRLADELASRPEWDNFREQFTPKELEHFQYRYVQLMGQFRDDVLPTEELQIFQVITLDIMIQRTLREQRVAVSGQERITQDLEHLHKQDENPDALTTKEAKELFTSISSCESKYAMLADTIKVLSQRHESYLMRQSHMLKELKGTRDQRVKVFENSRQSFLGYLRALGEEDFRMQEGRDAELMRKATEKQAQAMARPQAFPDGVVDQPLLTPETVQDY
jgi:hypothetical protein